MKNTSNQNAAQEKPNQKKEWIEPKLEIINNGYIRSGTHTNGSEAIYATGQPSSSPTQFAYFS